MIELLLILIALIIWAMAGDLKEYAEDGKLGNHYNTINNSYNGCDVKNNYDGEYEIIDEEEDFYERRN